MKFSRRPIQALSVENWCSKMSKKSAKTKEINSSFLTPTSASFDYTFVIVSFLPRTPYLESSLLGIKHMHHLTFGTGIIKEKNEQTVSRGWLMCCLGGGGARGERTASSEATFPTLSLQLILFSNVKSTKMIPCGWKQNIFFMLNLKIHLKLF